jgi:hypothetical protein
MQIFPISTLTDVLFGNRQKDQLQGLEIWTDESIEGRDKKPEMVRIQVVPQNINFVQRSRISEQIIKDGRAFFFWRKDRESNHLDLMEVQLQGVTRSLAKEKLRVGSLATIRQHLSTAWEEAKSIVTSGDASPSSADEPTPKQREWLKFWRITREPFVSVDRLNYHHIRLNTPAFPGLSPAPGGLEFIGHFTGPVQFGEVAENPFLVTWQLSLIVHRTSPSLDQFFDLATRINVKE